MRLIHLFLHHRYQSHQNQLCGPGYGVANSEGNWEGKTYGYGKGNIKLRTTIRQKTPDSLLCKTNSVQTLLLRKS